MQTTLPDVATAPDSRTGITGWIARHPIATFLAWLFTVGQALAFTPHLVDVPVPSQVFIVATSVLGLFLPAVAITWIADGREAAVRSCADSWIGGSPPAGTSWRCSSFPWSPCCWRG